MSKTVWLRLAIGTVIFALVAIVMVGRLIAAPSPMAREESFISREVVSFAPDAEMIGMPELAATPTPRPRRKATPTPGPKPKATPTAEPLYYNLPQATLKNATGLYASPNRAELIVPVSIPVGEKVFVMGKNATGSHLRVVWNTGVGWVPVSFTDYNGKQNKLAPLPVFEREPPACAEPLTTQFGLNSKWTSDQRQKIAVIADLFRSKYGPFPKSFLSLRVNGTVVDSSRRPIVEQGQFSLKDVVFTVPQDLQEGDTVGYQLETSSNEPLTFMATIFSVPGNCQWDLD